MASPTKDSLKSPEESVTSDTYEEDSSAAGRSGTDNGSGEDSEARNKYRLQRQKGKSRKTFRFRKGSKKGLRVTNDESNSNKTDPDIVPEEDPNMISIEGKEAQEHKEENLQTSTVTEDQSEHESKSSQIQQSEQETENKEG